MPPKCFLATSYVMRPLFALDLRRSPFGMDCHGVDALCERSVSEEYLNDVSSAVEDI